MTFVGIAFGYKKGMSWEVGMPCEVAMVSLCSIVTSVQYEDDLAVLEACKKTVRYSYESVPVVDLFAQAEQASHYGGISLNQ